jgi:hypothetical protein
MRYRRIILPATLFFLFFGAIILYGKHPYRDAILVTLFLVTYYCVTCYGWRFWNWRRYGKPDPGREAGARGSAGRLFPPRNDHPQDDIVGPVTVPF